jgi:hypothetical protein
MGFSFWAGIAATTAFAAGNADSRIPAHGADAPVSWSSTSVSGVRRRPPARSRTGRFHRRSARRAHRRGLRRIPAGPDDSRINVAQQPIACTSQANALHAEAQTMPPGLTFPRRKPLWPAPRERDVVDSGIISTFVLFGAASAFGIPPASRSPRVRLRCAPNRGRVGRWFGPSLALPGNRCSTVVSTRPVRVPAE